MQSVWEQVNSTAHFFEGHPMTRSKEEEQATRRVLAQRLREERERLGLTLEDLAATGGLAAITQQRYETGDRTPDASYLLLMAEAHNIDVLYIVTGRREHTTSKLTRTEAQLLERYRKLPSALRQHVDATTLIAWLAYQERKGYHLHFDADDKTAPR